MGGDEESNTLVPKHQRIINGNRSNTSPNNNLSHKLTFFNPLRTSFSRAKFATTMAITPHFLVIPYPVLGHVNPLIHLSQILAKHGCSITFLNTEFSHKRLSTTGVGLDNLKESGIKFVTLPDGLGPEDDRSDQKKVVRSIKTNMPSMLPKLIQDLNALDANNKITCMVVTLSMTWALKVGHTLGIKGTLLWPASATSLALCDCIPRLIDDGVIDSYGKTNT